MSTPAGVQLLASVVAKSPTLLVTTILRGRWKNTSALNAFPTELFLVGTVSGQRDFPT
jgi:hypothetical protein